MLQLLNCLAVTLLQMKELSNQIKLFIQLKYERSLSLVLERAEA